MPGLVPTPAARRQRRHRARRKQGRFVVPVEVTCELITALVDQGDVDEGNSSDLDHVGKAITAAARRGLDLSDQGLDRVRHLKSAFFTDESVRSSRSIWPIAG